MDDIVISHPDTDTRTPVVKPPRSTGAKWLVALLVIALLAYLAWRVLPGLDASTRATAADIQRLNAQIDDLTHTLAQLRGNADTLRARQDDSDRVDKSVRDQLLGLSQRAGLLEDAVANLADKRLSGHDALLLDEAELLLTLGGERYTLFHDAPATIAAYRLADITLSEVEDAAFSTVRQSIAAEIAALDALHAADPVLLSAQLTQLRAQVAQLPAVTQTLPATAAPETTSRLARVLGSLVQIHHGEDAQTQMAMHDVGLARALAGLDLRDAEAALLARDAARYRAALTAARVQLTATLDSHTPEFAAVSSQLDALDKAVLAPPPPPVLGAALRQLRNLRATHALHAAPAAAAKPDVAKPDVTKSGVTKSDGAQK